MSYINERTFLTGHLLLDPEATRTNILTLVWALWRLGLLSSYRSAFSAWFNKLILPKLSCRLGNVG